MAERRKKGFAAYAKRKRIVPHLSPTDLSWLLDDFSRELSDAHASRPPITGDGEVDDNIGDQEFEAMARRWRDRIDEMLSSPPDGRPQKPTYQAHVKPFDEWKAKKPGRPDADYYRRHMGAKTDKDVRRCRSALSRARNSK